MVVVIEYGGDGGDEAKESGCDGGEWKRKELQCVLFWERREEVIFMNVFSDLFGK